MLMVGRETQRVITLYHYIPSKCIYSSSLCSYIWMDNWRSGYINDDGDRTGDTGSEGSQVQDLCRQPELDGKRSGES